MTLIEHLLATLPADPVPVRNVIMGVHWTLVSSKFCGLGSTIPDSGHHRHHAHHGHSLVRDVGKLHQKSAQELAQWILSDNTLEASIGIAAINSLLEIDESRMEQINAADIIERECGGKNLVIVGHFPFVERMKFIAKNCWVIEKHPAGGDFPEQAAREFIPQAQIIAITGTSLINHTIDNLLSLCPKDSMVMLLGPSTPLSSVLFNYGISFVSGARVYDENTAILSIQQGAAFPQVQGVRLLTMTKNIY
ncbi:MAG: DUF364 domain-containing protein [Chloroflexi bacterium]|nr:DUF364 domain-containing protein [Chloroflexota bacterium]